MTHATNSETVQLRERVLAAWRDLRRLRSVSGSQGVVAGGELAEAEAAYESLSREYAIHRIAAGLGPDPEVLDRETFERLLYSMAEPGRFAKYVPKTRASCIAREVMTAMLSSGAAPGELLPALAGWSAARDAFDQQAPLRQLIRKWAEPVASDAFVGQCLEAVASHQADFARALGDATALLNNVRMKYEIENRGADRIAVERGPDGTLEVVAASAWDALVRPLSDEANEIHACIAAAELAAGRIEHAARDINRELSRFFAELVPRWFALLSRLPRARRNELTGGVRPTPKLAARLVEAAETTDFVADPALKLGFVRQTLPARFKLLTTQRGYERIREVIVGRKVQDASTVVVHRTAPTPSPQDR